MTDFTANPTFDISEADLENILSDYDGPKPPANMRLHGRLAGMFLTRTVDNAPMLKLVAKVDGGDYDGYTEWDNIPLTGGAAFKWNALCEDVLTISLKDLATEMKIDPDAESGAGYRVESIGKWINNGETEVQWTTVYESYKDENGVKSKRSKMRDLEAA
jgi:hypothetical protein